MAYDVGLKVGVEGNAEFKRAVREINDELKTMDSALRLVESSYKGQMNSMDALKAKGDALQVVYDKQETKIKELSAALQNAQSAESQYASKAIEVKSKLAAAQAEMERLKNSTGDTTEEQKRLTTEIKDLSKALKAAEQGQSASTRAVNDWQRQVNNATVKLNNLEGELKDNKRYMSEAEKATDKTAKSIDRYGKEAKEAAAATDDVAQKGNLLTKMFAGGFLANIATQALNGVTRALKDMAAAGLKLASDLEEVQNVVDVAFGDDSGKVEAWASSAATSFGLSELSAKEFTGTLGAMMRSSGIVGDELADMSITLAGVAADFASFYNLDVEEAFDKVRQGIGGQTQGLKQLGINLNQANLMQTEYAKSLNKSWSEMTTAEQTMTRYNAILELGASSMGDFSRTSDSFANQLKIVSLQFDNLKLAIGEKLLPIATNALGALNQLLSGVAADDTASEKIDKLSASIDKANKTLGIIDSYKALRDELQQSGIAETEVAAKTEELNKVKQKLIEISGGVVTAIGIENGTFDSQVEMLESLTESEKKYTTFKLQSIALENTGAAAQERATEAAEQHAKAYEALKDTYAALQTAQESIASGEEFNDAGMKLEDVIDFLNASIPTLEQSMQKASDAMAQSEADTRKGKDALEGLVAIYGSASAAADVMGISLYELNARLGTASSATDKLSEVERDAVTIIENLGGSIDELQASYNDMYKSAEEAISGTIGLWKEMDTSAVKSVKEVQSALDSQIKWLANYNTNLTALENRKIDGVDLKPLLENLSDGSEEAASIVAGLATATDDEIRELAKSLGQIELSKGSLSGTIADIRTDLVGGVSVMADEAIAALSRSGAAGEAAQATMQGYVDQVYAMKDDVVNAHREVAKAANDAYKDELKIQSPSRVAMEATEDYFEGHILKARQMTARMETAYSEPARKANLAVQSAIPPVFERPERDTGAQAAIIGDSVSKALAGAIGADKTINLTVNLTGEIDGRQMMKATREYRIEADELAGQNLID